MPEQIDIRDFPGLMDETDPRDVPVGAAQIQVNICSISEGTLQVRLGYKPVLFDED